MTALEEYLYGRKYLVLRNGPTLSPGAVVKFLHPKTRRWCRGTFVEMTHASPTSAWIEYKGERFPIWREHIKGAIAKATQ